MDIVKQITDINRQCDIILEQIRLEYIEPIQAIEQLKELYRSL